MYHRTLQCAPSSDFLWYTDRRTADHQKAECTVATQTQQSAFQLLEERPRLMFTTELDGAELLRALAQPGVLELLSMQGYGVALMLPRFDETRIEAAQLLANHNIDVIASLCLPPEEGFAFNLQNYPRAFEHYSAFHTWARANDLRFAAVSLNIEPPLEDLALGERPGGFGLARALLRRMWLARENILYPSAQNAYGELIVTMHLDGYEAHVFQMPVIADDRRAGTSLLQRALDIVDLPADVDVLMCSSSLPLDPFRNDLGGALIASYGAGADAISVGSAGDGDPDAEGYTPLPWPALRRDLLLAAQHTELIYVYSLEDCVARDLLPRIVALDWNAPARPTVRGRALIGVLRATLFGTLFVARFGLSTLAWAGWAVALVLWLRGRRSGQNGASEDNNKYA